MGREPGAQIFEKIIKAISRRGPWRSSGSHADDLCSTGLRFSRRRSPSIDYAARELHSCRRSLSPRLVQLGQLKQVDLRWLGSDHAGSNRYSEAPRHEFPSPSEDSGNSSIRGVNTLEVFDVHAIQYAVNLPK